MRVLIDTHVWLWWLTQPEKLNQKAVETLRGGENVVHLSVASVWEAAVKVSAGRLDFGIAPDEFVPASIKEDRFVLIPIRSEHALRAGGLPRHHADPFDRMLIAQAQIESLPVLTADARFDAYDVRVIRAR